MVSWTKKHFKWFAAQKGCLIHNNGHFVSQTVAPSENAASQLGQHCLSCLAANYRPQLCLVSHLVFNVLEGCAEGGTTKNWSRSWSRSCLVKFLCLAPLHNHILMNLMPQQRWDWNRFQTILFLFLRYIPFCINCVKNGLFSLWIFAALARLPIFCGPEQLVK